MQKGLATNCLTLEANIGFIQLAPIMCRVLPAMGQRSLATTCIEKSDEIPNNQTTYKTRAGVDTPENQSEVVKEQGGLRAAARHLKIKPSYLAALMDGTKKNPGDWYLRKLGLRRVTYIEET